MRLSMGEKLYLLRRRRLQTQPEAARAYGVSLMVFATWEKDRKLYGIPTPPVSLRNLQVCEACVILRRRAGMRQEDLAKKLDISLVWLVQMEQGTADLSVLADFWGIK